MIQFRFILILLAIFTGRVHALPEALAQAEPSTRTRLKGEAPKQDTGRLLIVAFQGGMPAQGVELNGAIGRHFTKTDGTVSLNLPAGQHSLFVPQLDKMLKFQIYKDQETQITLHVLQKGSAEISQPDPLETEQPASSVKVKTGIRVIDAQSKPIAQASIIISDRSDPVLTDSNGEANLEHGRDSQISIFHSKYQTQTLSLNAETTIHLVRMKLAENELEELVVLAPKIKGSTAALVEVRRQSSAVTDVLGSEQMSRAGDSDAAASLRRVTGLTLVGGKYVYVRGLGERYSGVQMNGFSLPSPEPSRRVVPMDLFPTSILESVVVQKSYTPDLPGEFGGGLIQLKTRSLPEKFFFRSSLSFTAENEGDRLTYQGSDLDWLGFDDGGRQLPAEIRQALSSGKKFVRQQNGSSEGLPEEKLTTLGRSLSNNYGTTKTSSTALPGLSVSMGDRFKVSGQQLGVSGSVLYGQDVDSGDRSSAGYNVGAGNKLVDDFSEKSNFSETETRLAGSLDVGLQISARHALNANTFLLRNSTQFTQQEQRISQASPNSVLESTTLAWTERQVWTRHFSGQHKWDLFADRPLEVKWKIGISDALRDSPDRREYAYERTGTSVRMRDGSGGNRRTWSRLDDSSQEYGMDLAVPIIPERLSLKIGASYLERSRQSEVFRFFFQDENPNPQDLAAQPEDRFSRDQISPGQKMLQNLTDAADSYAGEQTVQATYAMTDFTPTPKWNFQAGVRTETSKQTVKTFRYFEPQSPFAESEIEMRDVLPAYSVSWKPNAQWRARLAYSETLARPDFREMSTAGFIDDETGYEVQGNAGLKGTVIRNIDHRWEYYFSTDEYASIGGFYKDFQSPIEVMFVPGVNRIQTFDNAKAARNFGLEVETRVGLRHVTRPLRRWSILGNVTWIQSRIELDERNRGIQTSDQRPLQGQSPYVINFQLQYDRPSWGFSATALYNVVGDRITEVGTNQIPDTYEQPAHQVDFVTAKSIAKNISVGLRAKNLLDPLIVAKQDTSVVRSYRRGRSVGLNLNATF